MLGAGSGIIDAHSVFVEEMIGCVSGEGGVWKPISPGILYC